MERLGVESLKLTDSVKENIKKVAESRKLEPKTLERIGMLRFDTKEELGEFLKLNPSFKQYLGWLNKYWKDKDKGGSILNKNIFPSYLPNGRIFFYIIYNPLDKNYKYDNIYLGDVVDRVRDKKTKMYGLETLDYTKDSVYIVEGVFDRIRLVEEGYNTVSLLGTSISDYMLKMLKRFDNIYLTMDSDNAGNIAINTAKDKFNHSNYKGKVYERELYFGTDDTSIKDVDDLFREGYTEIKYK